MKHTVIRSAYMDKLSFEQAITRIDDIVKTLEKGDAPLEQSLSLFEEGTNLIKFCGNLLDTAEQKVVRLQKGSDGTPEELPFDTEE
jgi:exodeoxyribonuclease VII small subunit